MWPLDAYFNFQIQFIRVEYTLPFKSAFLCKPKVNSLNQKAKSLHWLTLKYLWVVYVVKAIMQNNTKQNWVNFIGFDLVLRFKIPPTSSIRVRKPQTVHVMALGITQQTNYV